MSKDSRNIDPDDFFADTRMSFGDHIEDLRVHLWRAIKGFFVACLLGFVLGKPVLAFIAKPVEEQLQAFYDRRVEKVADEIDSDENKDANKATDYTLWSVPAKQMQAIALGKFDEASAMPKPGPDDKKVRIWMSSEEDRKSVV